MRTSIILSILLVLSLGANYLLFQKKTDVISENPKNVFTEKSKSSTGTDVIKTNQVYRVETIKQIPVPIVKTIETIKDVDLSKVDEVIKINQELNLKLKEKDLVLNDKENEIKQWKDKFNNIIVNNKENSAEVKSEVSPIITQEFKRESFLGPKQTIITVNSENPSVTFNGAEKYEIKAKQRKAIFDLSADISTGKYIYRTSYSQGLQYYNASLKLEFNPDGILRPYLYVGRNTYVPEYFFYESVWSTFVGAGLNIKLIKL